MKVRWWGQCGSAKYDLTFRKLQLSIGTHCLNTRNWHMVVARLTLYLVGIGRAT